jgi:hypothetical protein
MNLSRKIYTTRREKVIDFIVGFLGWFFINGLLYTLLVFLIGQFSPDAQSSLAVVLLGLLPLLINIGALIYFGFTRRWIALGALAAFAAVLLLALLLGLLVYAICYTPTSFR